MATPSLISPVAQVVDAIDYLHSHLAAYTAIEQIVVLQRADSETDLPLLQRSDFGMLMCIVNTAVMKCCEDAQAAAYAALKSANAATRQE